MKFLIMRWKGAPLVPGRLPIPPAVNRVALFEDVCITHTATARVAELANLSFAKKKNACT